MTDDDINIGRFLTKRAQLDGARPGVIVGDRRLTFSALNEAASRSANALLALGVASGDRVAVLMRNGIDYLALYYGCAKIGAILCGINWRLAAPEIDYVLRDSEAGLLIYDAEFAPAIDALPKPATQLLPAATFVERCILAEPAEPAVPAISADAALVLVYTSGTTGHPKGAVLTHRQMFWSSTTMAASHDYHWGDVSLVPTPLFHVGGLSFATLFVHIGATLVMLPAWEASAALQLIAREKVNHFFAVPAMLRGLLEHAEFSRTDLSSVRWILSGGAPLPIELIHAFHAAGIKLQQTYGATETAGPATLVDLDHVLTKAGSIGVPYFHTEVRIVGKDGNEAAADEIGELRIRAPHLIAGYWRNPQATLDAFEDGWLKTGDLGRRDADGYLYVVDRAKDMIISGGENIYPAEIEAVLQTHPSIAEVAVIGVPDAKWGEIACAIAVLRPGRTLTLDAARAFCDSKLARYKIPRVLAISPTPLPRNATGKLLKGALRARYATAS